jgi:hypothetical protein
MSPRLVWLASCVWFGCGWLGCGGSTDEAPAGSSADTAGATDTSGAGDAAETAETPASYYDLTIVMPSGLQQRYNDEILPEFISFGCSHLPPPVRSLAVERTYPKPFTVLSLNLGFVIGDEADHPLTLGDIGVYPWGTGATNAPPSFKLVAKDGPGGPQYTFASWPATASGKVTILSFGDSEGEIVEGRIEGTLVNAEGSPVEAAILGEFRIVLPAAEQCGG